MPLPAIHARLPALPRLIGDEGGTSAVEFGLLALPVFALLGAILQIAFMTWAQENLDFTFQKAARAIFTGQFQAASAGTGATPAQMLAAIRSSMCGPTSPNGGATVYNCSGLMVDLKLGANAGTSFAGTAFSSPVDPSTRNWAAGFGTNYVCAPPGAIVIATAAVKFPLLLRLWNAGLSSFADGSVLLQSTAVFRTEPYTAGGTSPC